MKTMFLTCCVILVIKTIFLTCYAVLMMNTLFLTGCGVHIMKTMFLTCYAVQVIKTMFLTCCGVHIMKKTMFLNSNLLRRSGHENHVSNLLRHPCDKNHVSNLLRRPDDEYRYLVSNLLRCPGDENQHEVHGDGAAAGGRSAQCSHGQPQRLSQHHLRNTGVPLAVISVSDCIDLNTDPEPDQAFWVNTDPDRDPDPDSGSGFWNWIRILIQDFLCQKERKKVWTIFKLFSLQIALKTLIKGFQAQ